MNSGKEQVSYFRTIEVFLIMINIVVMVLILSSVLMPEQIVKQAAPVAEGWYLLEDGEKIAVDLPARIPAKQGEEIVLYHDTLANEHRGEFISTKGAQYDLKIFCGDSLLYEYEEYDFIRNAQMKSKVNCTGQIPKEMDDQVVSVHMTGCEHEECKFSEVYVGNAREIMQHNFKEFVITGAIVVIMAVWVIIAFAVAIFLRSRKMGDHRFINVGCFLLLCGVWCLTDAPFLQEHLPYPSLVCVISFYAFMLMAVPMLYFVKHTSGMQKYKVIDVLIVLFSLNAIGQGILNYLGIFEFIEMLFVTHLLLISGVAVLVVLLVREYLREQSKELKTILTAFAILAGSGILALVLYWLFEISYYGTIYEIGILVFVIALIGGLIMTMADNIIYKAEMQAYQRMAKEDKLTGLGNRRAFDEFINVFSKQIDEYDNAALIFMDLNGLKKINDTYGHSVGDELIIASANCIKKAYGEKGSCYRLGGDEFCTIILNPTQSEEELFRILDKEIQNYNYNSRYRISIARGMSCIRMEDGTLQTISDWKYHADQKMYENKGWQVRV